MQGKARDAQEREYNKKLRGSLIEVGEQVLVRNVGFQGPHKLATRWEVQPYQVVGKHADGPVYVVQPVAGGRKRTLHRNMLLPLQGQEEDNCPPVPASAPPSRSKQGTRQKLVLEEREESQSSDEDWEVTEWVQAETEAEAEVEPEARPVVPEPVVPHEVPAQPRRSTRARKPPDRLCVGCRTALALC